MGLTPRLMSQERDGRRARLLAVGKYVGAGVGGLVLLLIVLFVLGVIGVPDAGLEDNRWGEVDDQDVEVITEIGIDNPNPFGFGGDAAVAYDINLQGVRLAQGEGTGITVDSGSNSENLSTLLDSEQLPAWWSAHLNNDEVSDLVAEAEIDVSLGPLSGTHDTTIETEIDTDVERALDDASSEFEGEYPEEVPLIEITDVTTEWGDVDEDVTEILTTFEFENPNEGTVLVLPELGFEGNTTFNDIPMAEWETDDVTVIDEDGESAVGEDVVIQGGERVERTFLVGLETQRIGEWFPTHVEQSESTEILWASELVVEVLEDGSVGDLVGDLPISDLPGELRIPPGESTIDCEIDLQTGIFIDQDTDVQFQGCLTPTIEPDDIISADDGNDGII